MDVSKLDKMKVVDLRNELQARGLDTKGVKAVLVERLRAVLEGGEGENNAPATPTGTPAKRSRRTRSMTRSPSPSPKKALEPELEALPEEENEIAEEATEEQEMEQEADGENQEAEEEEEEQASEIEQKDAEEEEEKANSAEEQSEHSESEQEKEAEQDEEMKEDGGENDEKHANESEGDRKSRKRSHSVSSQHSQRSNERRMSKSSKEENPEDEPNMEDKQLGLSWFDSDLHLRIDPVTFTSAKPMSHEIYSLVWSGVRANYGVRDGKVCYEVRLAEETNMGRSHQFRDEPFVRGFRVGFSLPNTKLLLGEDENSFAYCETGRKAVNSEFTDYGKAYQLDDVIGCYLDLESTPCTIKYTLNGEDLGDAFEFDKSILGEDSALFPHIVTKGYEFHVNFADNENLLVNAERPKRMRRKPKKVLTDENNEKWEVVDETKPDESEKNEDADEEKKKETEKAGKSSDSETEKEEKTEKEDKEEAEAAEEADDAGKASEPASNGDALHVSDDGEQKKSENKEVKEEKKNDDHGSPSKRRRYESNKHEQTPEDEFEEVIPEPRDPVSLLPGYELIALIPEEHYIPGPQRPESRKDCEVILLVGLPGSGKTHWTLNRLKEQPDKRYHVIGADALISKMTIDGEPRKGHHKGRWEKVYEMCLNSLSSLEDIATKRRRNFILDQTNAYASAQRRKMKGFGDFKRIAVVCIPSAEELKRRNEEKGTAHTIREATLNNLRANFTLPSLEFGWFDDIIHTDLNGDEAKKEVKEYNEKGKKALDAMPQNKRNRNRHNRYNERSGGGGGGYRNNSGWQDNRNDRRRYDDRGGGYRNNSGWQDNRGGGYDRRRYDDRSGGYRNNSGGYRDNRNNRYGGGGGGGGGGGPSNWVHNNRNRYDDRYGGSGGGGGRHRDNYGGGNYRSSGSGSGSSRNQRDFRPGHHDNRTEDSRGGYDSGKQSSNGSSAKGSKWSTYPAQQSHEQQQQQQQQQWQQQWQQYHQQIAPQQQQQWGYGDMQAYANQWQNASDPNQQQQWMSWYQQQGNAQAGSEANYWSQYSYPTSNNGATGTEAKK